MSTYYLDSSALVKLYVPEAGSGWIDAVVSARAADGLARHVIACSEIGLVEVAAALARRLRERTLDVASAAAIRDRLFHDAATRFFMLSVRRDVIERAADLAARRSLRAYDAVHLATGLVLADELRSAGIEPPAFVSADDALNLAADSEGLHVSNPRERGA